MMGRWGGGVMGRGRVLPNVAGEKWGLPDWQRLEGEGFTEEVEAEHGQGHLGGAVADHFAVAGEEEGA